MKIKKAAAILTAILATLLVLPFPARAGGKVTGTVNLINVRRNVSGPGYNWDNINKVLTLSDLDLETDDDFGIKAPAGAAVVIEGDCRIVAARYGLSCSGSLTFKGDGKLTVEAGENGLFFHSSNSNHKAMFLGGNYDITGKSGPAIRSDKAEISLTAGSLRASSPTGVAVSGETVNLVGGSAELVGSLKVTHLANISGVDLTITSDSAAIISDNLITVANERIAAGDSEGSLRDADEYEGEKCVRMTSTYKRVRTSIIFGKKVPGYVDYILLAGAALGVACAVGVPILVKKRKTKKLYEKLEKEKTEK